MSKIEVNTVDAQCGSTVTIGSAGKTVSVPGNIVKTNALQASDGGNIVNQCGTTVTLGASGDTIALASGASQTGFGRTGTVDWDTSIKTSTVTAVTGKGYFVDTTSGGITVNLPAAAVGSIVAVSDYASTSASNNITVTPNGSEKINADNNDYLISTAGLAVTLVYADATRGWKSVTGSDADATGVGPEYIAATGGNQPTPNGCIVCTNYKVHKFTGPGTFTVTAGNALGSNTVDYIVVGGGGGGGARAAGGGGAGGYRESSGAASGCYSIGLPANSGVAALPVSASPGAYPIVVGGAGAGGTPGGSETPAVQAPNSSFSTITSTGGGGGKGSACVPRVACSHGGSGGGGGPGGTVPMNNGGTGNTPPVSPPQGNTGGANPGGVNFNGAGGGGAGAVGQNAQPAAPAAGGIGADSSISASPVFYAGGGGGGSWPSPSPAAGGAGGNGGGGNGRPGVGSPSPANPPRAGTINTGGGGGGEGGGTGSDGGAGGSGIVWIRYKFQ